MMRTEAVCSCNSFNEEDKVQIYWKKDYNSITSFILFVIAFVGIAKENWLMFLGAVAFGAYEFFTTEHAYFCERCNKKIEPEYLR